MDWYQDLQVDLILMTGTVTLKMASSLRRLYEQMPEPKYIIAIATCTITGGVFSIETLNSFLDISQCPGYSWNVRSICLSLPLFPRIYVLPFTS